MLVPETSDPAEKLAWATELIDKQNRPLPAEKLIAESIDIYNSRRDELGLAQAYRMYGLFYKSATVNQWQEYYKKNGFRDRTVTFENRLNKAIEYFDNSRDLLQKNGDVHTITNVYLQMAFTYELMDNKGAACAAYDSSLKSEQANSKSNPDLVTIVPREFKSFEHGISVFKSRLGCKV
ncbi:MAG: hypothetical protein HYU78_09020 [Rhodocyclales bacterium]|nr:hypothetical protein [Rhodocyclales bacterium]